MSAAEQWSAGAGDATTVMPRPVPVEPEPRRRVRRHVHAHDGECPRHCGGMTAVASWLRRYWRPRLIMVLLLGWIAVVVTCAAFVLVHDSRDGRLDQRTLGCQALVNQAVVARQPLPRPSICDDVAIQVRLGQQPTPTPGRRSR